MKITILTIIILLFAFVSNAEVNDNTYLFLENYQITAGKAHTCTIDDNGIVCWGDNSLSQLNAPTPKSEIKTITAGDNHTCVLYQEGSFECWGETSDISSEIIESGFKATQISASSDYTCASDNTSILCWGGEFGGGSFISTPFDFVEAIFGGFGVSCALNDGISFCWGQSANNYNIDSPPEELSYINHLAIGSGFICAIDTNGVLVCWGRRYANNPPVNDVLFTKVYAGRNHYCAIDEANNVECFGSNTDNQSKTYNGYSQAHSIAIGHDHTCIQTLNGPFCWGRNVEGQINIPSLMIDPDNDDVSSQYYEDKFPFNSEEWFDTDNDLIGDNLDADDDGDGVLDIDDIWPLDKRYSSDDDNDGLPNKWEIMFNLNHSDLSDAFKDIDDDGLSNYDEFVSGTSPVLKDTDKDTLNDGWEINHSRDPLKPDFSMSVKIDRYCVFNSAEPKCWFKNRSYTNSVPVYDSVINQTTFGSYNNGCMSENNFFHCWRSEKPSFAPLLKNMYLFSGSAGVYCAAHEMGLDCWTSFGVADFEIPQTVTKPNLVGKISELVNIGSKVCVIIGEQLSCWGYREDVAFGSGILTDLKQPHSLSLASNLGCLIDDGKVKCWGSQTSKIMDIPKTIKNPSTLAISNTHACVIDQNEVKCWGEDNQNQLIQKVTFYEGYSYEVVNPAELHLGDGYTCVLHENGVTCWGDNSPFYINDSTARNLLFDIDNDGVTSQHGIDKFPKDPTEWADFDLDGIGDNTDNDDDNDGVVDELDVFPLDSSEWSDKDGDFVGDNVDAFPNDSLETLDSDTDGVGDNSDNCLEVFNTEQLDTDFDGLGNACDDDDDNDGFIDTLDRFPLDSSEQTDTDNDGLGDNYEIANGLDRKSSDSDDDGLTDSDEVIFGTNPLSEDSDYDGVLDGRDKYPLTSLGGLEDSDGDGVPNVCDDTCLALGMVADKNEIPPYRLLEQPESKFTKLSPTAKVIVTSSQGENFFDIARYVDEVSIVGQTFLVSGSSSIDGFRIMPSVKYDLTNLKGSVDALYFSGPFLEYINNILLDSSTGVMQLSRLTDIGEEIVQFIASKTAADLLVFSDGSISTSEVKTAVLNNTDLTTLTLDTDLRALDDKVTTGAQVKHIILDNDGAGAMALGPNIQTLISGSAGVDQIYVPEGSVVDASNLKSGQDKIYLQGNRVDYYKSVDDSGNITMSRNVIIDEETFTEYITVASGANVATNDLIIFADQQVDTATLKSRIGTIDKSLLPPSVPSIGI